MTDQTLMRTSEIAPKSVVRYRAKQLSLNPAGKAWNQEYLWKADDAHKILNYKKAANNGIKDYKIMQYILYNHDKNNIQISRELNVPVDRIRQLKKEYEKSGCIIVKSKL